MNPIMHAVLWAVLVSMVLGGLGYLISSRRPVLPKPQEKPPADDPARGLFAATEGEPPTEDQIAQARLGGPRGAPELGAAPMAPQAAEQTPRPIDDGHVA